VTVGGNVFAGTAGTMTLVAADPAGEPAPPELLAVTSTLIVLPTSAEVSMRVADVEFAVPMALHSLPVHCCQMYVNEVGSLDHEPVVAVSVAPCCGVPVITGIAVFTGGASGTTPVGADNARTDRWSTRAITAERISWPTSAVWRVYRDVTAPAITWQAAP
jgi:hypothetical protein